MKLYELIDRVDDAFTPETHKLKEYILNTSDDNGGFLRTCFTRKRTPIKDHKIDELNGTIIGFDLEFDESIIANYSGGFTPLKMQLWYSNTIRDIEDMIDFNLPIYKYCYYIPLWKGRQSEPKKTKVILSEEDLSMYEDGVANNSFDTEQVINCDHSKTLADIF